MRKKSLRLTISLRFALIVLAVIALISVVSNVLINRQFEGYVARQQKLEADRIAQNVSSQYDSDAEGWNVDYIHGMGMYASEDGFFMKLYDRDGNVLWDAENHEMRLYNDTIWSINLLQKEVSPGCKGEWETSRYDLEHAGAVVGYLDVKYYQACSCCMNENEFQFLEALNRILAVIAAISLVGAVLMGMLLSNSIVKPISRVVETTQKISGGEYNTRIQENVQTRELNELTSAVNQMAGSLAEQEVLRKRLTSDVAHELRTPVANISSYIEMMIDGALEPSPDRLQSCYDELQRLSGLISDLERLRQVENEDLTLEKTDVDLRKLAQAALRNFESQLREKNLDGRISGDTSVVPADRDRIMQVVTNLLSNAIKYSSEGGFVQVTVKDTKDSGVICVEDNGIGIAEEDLGRIFERFYRTDKSRNRKTGGAGVGLTIVKAIVQAHKGTVTVESEVGRGSKFVVTLPKRTEAM